MLLFLTFANYMLDANLERGCDDTRSPLQMSSNIVPSKRAKRSNVLNHVECCEMILKLISVLKSKFKPSPSYRSYVVGGPDVGMKQNIF
jgi:hypothetical protein